MATNNSWNTPSNLRIIDGGTSSTSLTAYSVLCGGTTSTSALQQPPLGIGTSGYALTSMGSGALPFFLTQSGSVQKLATTTASASASVTFTSKISTTYSTYLVTFTGVEPSGSGVTLNMDWSTDNGSTYLSSNYFCGLLRGQYNSTTLTNNNSTTTCPLAASAGLSTGSFTSGHIFLFGMDQSVAAGYSGDFFVNLGANSPGGFTYGINTGTTAITALKFSFSSGNITVGTFALYGLLK